MAAPCRPLMFSLSKYRHLRSVSPEGLLMKLPNQKTPALLPRQVGCQGIQVGDEICDLLVVWLSKEGSATVVVPEKAAEELVANGLRPEARSKGRWGVKEEPTEAKRLGARSRSI